MTASGAGHTKHTVDSTFITQPISPVLLIVHISSSDTSSDTSAPGSGPYKNAAMATATSLGSYFKNGAAGMSGGIKKCAAAARAYAIAANIASCTVRSRRLCVGSERVILLRLHK